jgi:hypothetical protein
MKRKKFTVILGLIVLGILVALIAIYLYLIYGGGTIGDVLGI